MDNDSPNSNDNDSLISKCEQLASALAVKISEAMKAHPYIDNSLCVSHAKIHGLLLNYLDMLEMNIPHRDASPKYLIENIAMLHGAKDKEIFGGQIKILKAILIYLFQERYVSAAAIENGVIKKVLDEAGNVTKLQEANPIEKIVAELPKPTRPSTRPDAYDHLEFQTDLDALIIKTFKHYVDPEDIPSKNIDALCTTFGINRSSFRDRVKTISDLGLKRYAVNLLKKQ